MLYLGLDVHSKWMTVKGFDPETGNEVEIIRLSNDSDSLSEAFGKLDGPLRGAMESGTNAWAVYRILEPYFEQLVVVDPATVWGKEGRRGAKTDRRDARKLAVKMQRGELIPLYIPDVKTQDQRALARGRINASRHVTKLVNEIGSQLRSWGVILDCSLLSVKGQKLLETARERLPQHSQRVLDIWLEMLDMAKRAQAELDEDVVTEANQDSECCRLMSIPAVGALTALVVKAEIGDISRFENAASLVCYCGLCPTVSQSADKAYYGKLTKFCNRYLKYVLVLRAQGMSFADKDNPMRETYWRVYFRSKANHAKIAVARQLTRVIYRMLKSKSNWEAAKIRERRELPASSRAGTEASKAAEKIGRDYASLPA